MKTNLLLVLLVAFAATACTPARITRLAPPSDVTPATVVVHRQGTLNAGAVTAVLGINKADVVALRGANYVELLLNPGEYDFFVRSTQADRPFYFPITLAAGNKTCLSIYPNPINWAKTLFLTLGYFFGHTFEIERIACPAPEFYAPYRKLHVTYEDE